MALGRGTLVLEGKSAYGYPPLPTYGMHTVSPNNYELLLPAAWPSKAQGCSVTLLLLLSANFIFKETSYKNLYQTQVVGPSELVAQIWSPL